MNFDYLWHRKPCRLLVKPVFRPKIKRNALIELANGLKMIVPWRALRNPLKLKFCLYPEYIKNWEEDEIETCKRRKQEVKDG